MPGAGKDAFELLDPVMQSWVSRQGWSDFRPIQRESIVKLLGAPAGQTAPNLVVTAATSGGKTESAFLPALSMLMSYFREHRNPDRFCYMLYVAPLKALINDQYRRLCDMAKDTGIPVYLWHGDAPQGQKSQMLREHDGIIMITPESLESFLVNRGEWCARYMTPMVTVIDEFHAFLGQGRGKQLLSLLDRIDVLNRANGREPARRIALSATLSQLDAVGGLLSPRHPFEVVEDTSPSSRELDVTLKAFNPAPKPANGGYAQKEDLDEIGNRIVEESIGKKTLTFASSRMLVETTSAAINGICQEKGIRSEAFPHHGSLSKEDREKLEHRLVTTDKPTMAVATVTLELGIDIGDIDEVFQIGPTSSVASLRQRAGRSGRRGNSGKLECLVTTAKKPSEMEDDLLTAISEIELMTAGWFEPPSSKRRDVSVMVSEILSCVSQYGSAYADELYSLLVEAGAFWNVPEDLFHMVIGDMLRADMLADIGEGELALGDAGAAEIEDWHFYATFQSEESYTVKQGKKTIGEIIPPATSMMKLSMGGTFMLGGRYWQVLPPIDMSGRVINVKQVSTKSKFLVPTGKGHPDVCGAVKRIKLKLLSGDLSEEVPDYIDERAEEALSDAREYAAEHRLNGLGISLYDGGDEGSESPSEVARRLSAGYHKQALLRVEPPVDEAALNVINSTLSAAGLEDGGLSNVPLWRLSELVEAVVENWEGISGAPESFLDDAMVGNLRSLEKYNGLLDPETLRYAYTEELLDFKQAKKWFDAYLRFAASI